MCFAKTPKAPKQEPPPQPAKLPDTEPLRRRNAGAAGALAAPGGSTMLTGASGVAQSSLIVGQSSLLGGGK